MPRYYINDMLVRQITWFNSVFDLICASLLDQLCDVSLHAVGVSRGGRGVFQLPLKAE